MIIFIFKDVEEILWQFHQLIRVLPQKSKIIANKEDSNIANLFKMGIWSEIEFFGTQQSESWSLDKVSSGYEIFRNYKKIKALNPIIFGNHNMLNALAAIAAIAALPELKIDQEDLIASSFYCWLKAKMLKKPFYYVMVETLQGRL